MWNHIPSYHRYYLQADQTDAYEYYKRMVQLLQAKHNTEAKKKEMKKSKLKKKDGYSKLQYMLDILISF